MLHKLLIKTKIKLLTKTYVTNVNDRKHYIKLKRNLNNYYTIILIINLKDYTMSLSRCE